MMQQLSAVEEIEITIDQAKAKLEKLEALNRLSKNPDFQMIIDTGYFRDKAAEIVLAKADPAMQTDEQQKACIKTIDAIGELRQYFAHITQDGQMARKTLDSAEIELQGALYDEQHDEVA